jgi:predicted acyl esterase
MYDASAITPKWDQGVTTEISDYLDRGYAVVGINTRGTGCSTGTMDNWNAAQTGRDGYDAVEWIARQQWSNGAVGMFGHSGAGVTQFFVAAEHPPHLKAIVPGAAPVDYYRDVSYPGGLFNYASRYHWAKDAQPGFENRAARVHIEAGDADCEERFARHKYTDLFEQLSDRPLDSEWYREHSAYSVADRIQTPTLIVFGWQDQNVHSRAIYVFNQLQGPKKILLAEDGHSFYIRSMQVRREKWLFFDFWLKGEKNGAMDGKPVEVWLTKKQAFGELIPDRIARYQTLRVEGTSWTKYYLSPKGTLDTSRSGDGRLEYLYPLGTTSAYGNLKAPPFSLGSLTFRTEPFARTATVVGPLEARMFVSSTQTDTSFFLILNQVNPDGVKKYLSRGYLLASMRDLDNRASRPGQPVYPFRRPKLLALDKVADIVIELYSIGSVISAGSRLELQIMAPAMTPEPLGQWGFLPLSMAHNTLYMSAAFPSHILFPIVSEP